MWCVIFAVLLSDSIVNIEKESTELKNGDIVVVVIHLYGLFQGFTI